MPIRTLQADAKFQILDCGLNTETQSAELLYELVPTVTAAIAADRRRAFTIAKGLDGKVLKALNFELAQYENGTLKSVNLVADYRTAETATNILSGVAKFGLALTGGALFSLKAAEPTVTWLRDLDPEKDAGMVKDVQAVCGKGVTQGLMKVHALSKQLSGAREAQEAKTKLTAAVTEADKAVTEARAALKAATEAGGVEDIAQAKEMLTNAVGELIKARKAAKEGPGAIASSAIAQDIAGHMQRHLTFTASQHIVPYEMPKTDDWKVEYSKERLAAAGIKAAKGLVAEVELKPLIAQMNDEEAPEIAVQTIATGRSDGIWFRSPATALLRMCVEDCNDTTSRLAQTITVPQWGLLSRLPLRNMAFAKNTTKLAFAADGTLLSLSSDSTAAAERASGAFMQAGDIALDYGTRRRALLAELEAADTAAEKAVIQQKLDLLTLNQQYAAAQSTVGPERDAQLATLNFQIQQTQKQIDLLELQAKLEALQAEAEQ